MKSDEIVRLIIRGFLVDWCEKYFVSLIIDIRNFGKIFIYVTMCIEIWLPPIIFLNLWLGVNRVKKYPKFHLFHITYRRYTKFQQIFIHITMYIEIWLPPIATHLSTHILSIRSVEVTKTTQKWQISVFIKTDICVYYIFYYFLSKHDTNLLNGCWKRHM